MESYQTVQIWLKKSAKSRTWNWNSPWWDWGETFGVRTCCWRGISPSRLQGCLVLSWTPLWWLICFNVGVGYPCSNSDCHATSQNLISVVVPRHLKKTGSYLGRGSVLHTSQQIRALRAAEITVIFIFSEIAKPFNPATCMFPPPIEIPVTEIVLWSFLTVISLCFKWGALLSFWIDQQSECLVHVYF